MGKEEDIKAMALEVAKAMSGQQDDWQNALNPMKSPIKTENTETYENLIAHPKNEGSNKVLTGFKTFTLLDKLFLDSNRKPIFGIPVVSQVGITGLPASGKSVLVEEIAITVAHSGKKVLLITSEDSFNSPSPRFDLQSRLQQKAKILKLNWDKITKNLFVLDTISHAELRNWNIFAKVYRYLCEKEKVELVLVDSVTLLETYRGALKFRLQELCRYNQNNGIQHYISIKGLRKIGIRAEWQVESD